MKLKKHTGPLPKDLPVIQILKTRPIKMVEMEMDIPDKIADEMVEYGKRVATRQDFFQIAFVKAATDWANEHMPAKTKKAGKK
jgi:hypothetical protein